jgi:hypothetical protein
MVQRCTNPNHNAFHNYGGRGVTICARWGNFGNFHADMSPRPPGLYLDRIDNDGPYAPENCRWVTMREQHANRRQFAGRVQQGAVWLKPGSKSSHARYITVGGVTRTVKEWAKHMGISRKTIGTRLFNGWSEDQAVLLPVQVKGGRVQGRIAPASSITKIKYP